jgi:hypothetical protein
MSSNLSCANPMSTHTRYRSCRRDPNRWGASGLLGDSGSLNLMSTTPHPPPCSTPHRHSLSQPEPRTPTQPRSAGGNAGVGADYFYRSLVVVTVHDAIFMIIKVDLLSPYCRAAELLLVAV